MGRQLRLRHVPPNQVSNQCPCLRPPVLQFQILDTVRRIVCPSFQRQVLEVLVDPCFHHLPRLVTALLMLFSVAWLRTFHRHQSHRYDLI